MVSPRGVERERDIELGLGRSGAVDEHLADLSLQAGDVREHPPDRR